MKYRKYLSILVSLIFSVGIVSYQNDSYDLDSTYSIQFKTGKAKGTFNGLNGSVDVDISDLANSAIDVSIDVNTIQTGNSKKDDHARGEKWFNTSKYPTMKYKSQTITKLGSGYISKGQLTIKDVIKPVEISFSYDSETKGDYLNGQLRINRKDFNINGNLFGFAVGKNVDVELHIPAKYSK